MSLMMEQVFFHLLFYICDDGSVEKKFVVEQFSRTLQELESV